MDMRKTLGKFTTATGTLVFPLYLNDPDDKFDDSEDKIKFKATIRLDRRDLRQVVGDGQGRHRQEAEDAGKEYSVVYP